MTVLLDFLVADLAELPQAAQTILTAAGDTRVWRFDGEMGVGKTTLIKAICQELGIHSSVQSPTFALVNEYVTDAGETIYHFDCYRLTSIDEALSIGIEEYFYSGNHCFIEWAERIEPLLPENLMKITLTETPDGHRRVKVEKNIA